MMDRIQAAGAALVLALACAAVSAPAQQAPPSADVRATDRLSALRREAEVLAGQERTLLGDLRKLEVERDLRTEEARTLDAEAVALGRRIEETTGQMAALDQAVQAARPGLDARLVDVYKLGRPGYARVLLGVGSFREIGRATRMISALARMDQRRVQEFTASIGRLATARAALDQQAARLPGLQAAAKQAAVLATRAAAARAALVRQIDARRDLAAQMAGELELATQKLQRTVQSLPGVPSSADRLILPIAPFRGALEWPLPGRVLSRFGQRRNPRSGTSTTQNGLEIESMDGRPVRSVHDGRVAFADVFAGLGQLVIIDHGGLAFSLYGYLGSMQVARGMNVTSGQTIGTAGRAPSGASAVYFELRIDGQPVDPLQWLKVR
jgi:septal ring factor EnvC (AmiA/AmiB activator)